MGRPPLPPGARRDHSVRLVLTAEERELLERLAVTDHVSRAQVLRALLVGTTRPEDAGLVTAVQAAVREALAAGTRGTESGGGR